MKKNAKKFLAIALTLMIVFTLSISAFAANITKAQAEEIALKDSGFSRNDVVYIRSQSDYDDGRQEWEVEYLVNGTNGTATEYEYEINGSTGRIISRGRDIERVRHQPSESFLQKLVQVFNSIIDWFVNSLINNR